MKILELNMNGSHLEFHQSSLSSKETVICNGQIVSELKSITGGLHKFEIEEDGELAAYEVVYQMDLGGVRVSVYRNGDFLAKR